MNRFNNLKKRLKIFKPKYDKYEAKKAEMLEVYTRWRQGEKLSRKEMQLLQASRAYQELEPLKQIIDLARSEFQETESFLPRPGAKERIVNELMGRIGRGSADETGTPLSEPALQPAYSIEPVGSDSELAFLPLDGSSPPPPRTVDPFSETVIIDGRRIERAASPTTATSRNLKLRVLEGDEVGREYNIAFLQMIIGRGLEAVIQLDSNAAASRRHALLTVDGDRVFISDLGSGNGVYVDGVRITEPTPLRVGSQISIGEQSLEVAEIQRTDVQLSISFREIEGPDVDKVYSVHVKEMTVGRGKAARIRFADATSTLSRLHARFDLKDGQIYVTDLGSKNGTYVDGELIDGPTPIQEGSVIKFGGVVCEVVAIETLR